MGSMKKTDNANLALKVELRRLLLEKAGLRRLRVLDLYAGEGQIWRELRKQFKLEAYLPCDRKPRQPGTLKAQISEGIVEALDPAGFNVIDADSYGEPWEAWTAIARKVGQRTAVFLTHGVVVMGQTSHFALRRMGIPVQWQIPVKREVSRFAAHFFLTPEFENCRIVEAHRAESGNAIYYGLLIEPKENTHG